MKLGAFTISLAVKNLQKSKCFYEKLGIKKPSCSSVFFTLKYIYFNFLVLK
jgi:predicted lactoylglutathione lyase